MRLYLFLSFVIGVMSFLLIRNSMYMIQGIANVQANLHAATIMQRNKHLVISPLY